MDKEPTVAQLWVVGITWGLVGLLAWRWRVNAGLAASLLGIPLVWAFHWELADPHVGPAIRHEAGQSYITQAYLSLAVCLALHVSGVVWRSVRSMRPGMTQSDQRG